MLLLLLWVLMGVAAALLLLWLGLMSLLRIGFLRPARIAFLCAVGAGRMHCYINMLHAGIVYISVRREPVWLRGCGNPRARGSKLRSHAQCESSCQKMQGYGERAQRIGCLASFCLSVRKIKIKITAVLRPTSNRRSSGNTVSD